MTNLANYLKDGADPTPRAVLMILQGLIYNIEPTINVARWENCREQGYVITVRAKDGDDLNIAFFEHRNSDDICAVKWCQKLLNSPTIDTAVFGDVYKTKWDVSFSVSYREIYEMAQWIKGEVDAYLSQNKTQKQLERQHCKLLTKQ